MKTPAHLISLFILLLMLSPGSGAQELDNRYVVSIGAVGYFFNDDKAQDDDIGYQIGFEMPFIDQWTIAYEYWDVDSDVLGIAGQGEGDVDLFHVGANYHFSPVNGWIPYLGAGIGSLQISRAALTDVASASIDLSAGLKFNFSDNWQGKLEAMLIEPTNSFDRDWALGASVGYRFGSTAAPVTAPVQVAVSGPVDSDMDGVFDDVDACSNTPRGRTVDARGCELDSDRDGVVDSRDACPDTNINLAVDARGCVILDETQRRQTLAVLFDTNMSAIRDEYQDEIAEFAQFLQEYNNTSAVIEGHTDSDGSEAYNMALSERRANAVMNELINRYGIAANRLSAVGYGESRPVASNDTAAGKAQNRRIVADVSVSVQTERQR